MLPLGRPQLQQANHVVFGRGLQHRFACGLHLCEQARLRGAVEVSELSDRQGHRPPGEPGHGLGAAPRHGQSVLEQGFAAVGAADHHGVERSQVPRGAVLGLEGTRRVRRSAEGPGLLEAPLPALREALVVLELLGVVLASGGLQLNALNELMSFNTTSGLANMFIEPNTGGNNNGEVIFGYGHMNASDRKLKQNIREIPQKQAQQLFDELEPKIYDRVEGPKDQIGFVAQDVLAAGELGKALCKPMGDGELLALDYQKLSVVLWGVVKSLQKRVDKLEKKRGRSS